MIRLSNKSAKPENNNLPWNHRQGAGGPSRRRSLPYVAVYFAARVASASGEAAVSCKA